MPVVKINVNDIGEVEVMVTKRARRISLSITSTAIIRVSCPYGTDMTTIKSFVIKQKDWIAQHRQARQNKITFFEIGKPYTIGGTTLTLRSLPDQDALRCHASAPNTLIITIPQELEATNSIVQNFTRKVIGKILQSESSSLHNRALELAKAHGLTFRHLSIKNMRSRWGSCSTTGDIVLNCHLLRLPSHLADYVILHELAHLVHHNHSKDFHEMLNKLCDGHSAEYNAQLRNFSPII